MMYQYIGKDRVYSVLSFEGRTVKLTKEQDREFSDWLSFKIKGGNV
jgi:hypothetical protein